MKKKKILIIICSIFIVLLIILLFTKKDRFQDKLITYISQKNFVLDVGTLYEHKDNNLDTCNEYVTGDCESKALFFNVSNYNYFMTKRIKKDGVLFELVPSYSYKTKIISYNYRSSYNNGVLIYMGEYNPDTERFTCELDYSYGVSANKDIICNYIKEEITNFYIDAFSFITDSYLLNKMK